jgi:hypothetical protein
MRLVSASVPRAAIDAEIVAATYPGHEPARWALPLLDELDRNGGGWKLMELDDEALARLWLPPHHGEACHGDTMRLGDGSEGTTLEEAHAWLNANADAYASANPSCWGRITHAARSQQAAIVVSPHDVGDRIKPSDAALVVVDGFHRALGYWKAGHRSVLAYVPVGREHVAVY